MSLLSLPIARAAECPDISQVNNQYPAAKLIVVDADAVVSSTFCDGYAGYTNETYLSDPEFVWLGTGHETASGTEFDLGAFVEGEELVFAIYVRNTGYWYYSGPGSRNDDGQVHASMTERSDGVWDIGFEDLYGGGDRDYNDINIVVEINPSDGVIVVPDDGTDTDGDGVDDYDDNCIFDANSDQADSDGDGIGDVCDIVDDDDDGIDDAVDNCLDLANPDQADADGDGAGDACDACPNDADNDADGDGVCGDVDNCPAAANADQSDADGDGSGDTCDDCTDIDADGVCVEDDVCPDTQLPDLVPTSKLGTWRWADIDGDGVFDTTESKGKGPGRAYTIEDTAGCSCAQIIDELELGEGHTKNGCSISAMDDWTALQQ